MCSGHEYDAQERETRSRTTRAGPSGSFIIDPVPADMAIHGKMKHPVAVTAQRRDRRNCPVSPCRSGPVDAGRHRQRGCNFPLLHVVSDRANAWTSVRKSRPVVAKLRKPKLHKGEACTPAISTPACRSDGESSKLQRTEVVLQLVCVAVVRPP